MCQPHLVTPTPGWLRIARGVFALLGLAAIVESVRTTTGSLMNLFSYFTVESNVLAVVVLAVGAVAAPTGRAWAWFRGLATFAMVVTGLVYLLLLSGLSVGLTADWVNDVVHRLQPVVVLVDWILVGPVVRGVRRTVVWLAYPLAYFAYVLARGPSSGFYPYPFTDPTRPGGYGRVAIWAVVLAAAFAVLAWALGGVGDRLPRRHGDRGENPDRTREPVRS